ncbi:MAG: hypothetical protein GX448_04720 [Planctomycetes bacterium]|nr:hypothetical protein [Planctomycetota bacterium]
MGSTMNPIENPDSPTVLLRRLYRWRMAFLGLIILIAGFTLGAAAAVLLLPGSESSRIPGGGRGDQMMLERIMPRLRLSREQAERVGPVLRKHMQKLEEIREQGRIQIAAELEAMNEEMSSLLSPDQQQRWRDLLRGLPGEFPRGPGRQGLGPRGPQGPRGRGQGQLYRAPEGPQPSPSEPAGQK